jgi:basic amino acid/polyamine antiporter, APA family
MTEMAVRGAETGSKAEKKAGVSLAREMGFFSVLAFGISCISLSSSGQLPFSTIAGAWPGANLPVILTVAMVLSLFHAYTYAVIGSAAPRAGADYYVASRSLSAPLAFASSWTFVVFSALVAGTLIALIPQSVLPVFFRIFGMVGGSVPAMVRLADSVAAPENIVSIGTVFVVVTFLLILLPARFITRTLKVGVIVGLLAWGMMLFVLASSSPADFAPAWDKVMGSGSYLNHLIQAKTVGLDPQAGSDFTIMAGLLMGFWLYFGYFIPTFFAGEIKRPERSLLAGSMLSLLVTWAIFLIASLLLLRLVSAEWLAAESFLYQSDQFKELSMPWIVFYVAVLQPNLALMLFLFFAWVFTLINLAQSYFYFCSRIILSWAEDGLIPNSLSFVHPALRSPLIAVLIVAIMAEIGLVNAALSPVISSQFNFVFFVVAVQLVPVLAITILPFTRRDWFEAAVPFVRLKIGPLPVITLVGGITLVYMMGVMVASALSPVFGGITANTTVSFLLIFGSGLAWYYGRKSYMKMQAGKVGAEQMPERTAAD